MEIILASSSPHRKKLFSTLNISFKVVPSNVDENKIKKLAKTPEELVIKLAIAKAKAVVRKLKDKRKDDFLVIGADSTAALKIKKGWLFFDKPKNKYEARKMALELKGKAHRFYTGLALISSLGKQKTKVVFSDVYFKNFSNKVLHNYIESKIWHGRAGGYDIKKDKSQLIEKYQGSYTNILGLPLEKLIPLLKSLGVKIEKEGGEQFGKEENSNIKKICWFWR